MNCEKAYYYMLYQLTELREQFEALQAGQEGMNVVLCIKQIQTAAEEIRQEDNRYEVIKAPRQGSTTVKSKRSGDERQGN